MNTDWVCAPNAAINEPARREAEHRQTQLTKPPGALGRLESLAIRLAGMQGTPRPTLDRVHIGVFAGDHGVVAEGVSAFPQAVTTEMVRNFARGGAAISVLARQLGATLEVLNLGTVVDPGPLDGVLRLNLGPGTANFAKEPAMTAEQLARALHAGRQTAERAQHGGAQLFIGGEMGIGNTTAAAAVACALLDAPAESLAGPGTGLDAHGVARKAKVIRDALVLHRAHAGDPMEILRRLGGFEIAALAGSYLACAKMGVPVLVDGFISTAAALVATRASPGCDDWFFYSHASAEPGHVRMLDALKANPLLDLGMRLGEGSGAAVAVPILRLACALHNGMATFAEAGVSEKSA
ncbi:MAG: nicotinate-nucleotide--dimethylbenzimidazole phosphoribosyltransferase [Candidatus Muproteobacteria bacterium RBG_16_65_31]|uniref:Nicotinate-nucleotide--dimethylbenzimidazole phosphoribosyltransferase n=2 Tax=Candidatus Muproteobacteria TaxID=1817795 RepID=A0A1F6TFQ4_9PROT|nr:MAG: nicotinate-nucleotide--dimethylbenzimidazole phosphoribosyltransferase [Candidatus Muproteobacteria bacterium RBG_16_65_31]OGI51717.1 MAG: nicotinate-nucleotide--dimethylbenzimidazole phosphoribosyltransferase [Candidatus Muproteobacteria bacterium RIFCSPHIGHO2_02_FULL_65_16]